MVFGATSGTLQRVATFVSENASTKRTEKSFVTDHVITVSFRIACFGEHASVLARYYRQVGWGKRSTWNLYQVGQEDP